jgi:hypothetical protein
MIEVIQSAVFYEEPKILIEDWNDKYVRLIINPVLTKMKDNSGNVQSDDIWVADTLLVEKPYSRNSVIEALIRTRYTISDELGILRQRNTKPDEFQDYNEFVENCKTIATNLGLYSL